MDSQDHSNSMITDGLSMPQNSPQPMDTNTRRPSRDSNSGIRILCPVDSCPEALVGSNRHFKDFASIKNHLNDHCTGHLSGAVPLDFLKFHNYSQCNVCDRVLHSRFRGTCRRCQPFARTINQMNTMRNQVNSTNIPNISLESSQHHMDQLPTILPSLTIIHEVFVPTIKNIPVQLRRLWSQCLSKAIAQVVWHNNETSWSELQMLPKCTLCCPKRGGKSHKSQRLAWTRSRLQRWLAGDRSELWQDLPQYKRPGTKSHSEEAARLLRQERCINLVGEGGISNACKALVSQPPISYSREISHQMQEKHPKSDRPVDLSSFGNSSSSLVPLADAALVESCIRSFHRLSGGGASGLRPIHLKNCLTTEHRDEVLEHSTSLINILAKGEAPESIAQFIAGATLTALPKKNDDIRPVAVGEVWRRLTAKCLCNSYKEQSSSYFFPLQIGVGQTLGTEIGLETASQWCQRNKNNQSAVVVKVDFSNAFNCVDRQAFLEQCRHQFPGLSRWAEWCYGRPSNLYFGADTLSSETGVQQGDPIGPLLFSLALQPLLHKLDRGRSSSGLQLAYSYLDDLTLAGEQVAVAEAFYFFKAEALKIGLKFNTSKCEVIPAAGHNSILDKNLFPGDTIFLEDGNFELLGGPIGSREFCNQHTQRRVDKVKEILSALGELPDPQVALILLRNCASFSKLVFSLRVVPHRDHKAALNNYDNAVRDCIESFLCCSLSDSEWSLANLSTKMGGLGLRKTEQHSPAAFLSSQMSCRELCSKLDRQYVFDPVDINTNSYAALADYNASVSPEKHLSMNAETFPRQQTLSQAIDSHTLGTIRELHRNNVHYQAHINHTTASGAGTWLHTLPARALGTHVEPLLYRTMIQHWLRTPVYESEFHCPLCDGIVDRYGDHCLTCACGGDRTKRHNLLRNEVYHFCNSAGLFPELEKPGLLQPRPLTGAAQENGASREVGNGRRPADVYLPRWRRGTPAALDFAVTSGLRSDSVNLSAEDGSAVTKAYEDFKCSHLDTRAECEREGITFIPLICEADGGGWGPAAHGVWGELAKHKSILTGEKTSTVATQLLQSLGLILHRENARAILRRSPSNVGRECNAALAAAVACNIPPDT